ncbi:MAG: type I DNA topoisomerase [Planctomycetota bacterium]
MKKKAKKKTTVSAGGPSKAKPTAKGKKPAPARDSGAASKALVIVESPAKTKTIGKILGDDYIIRSSYGHIRDLPKSKLGIDIDDNFKPGYITIRKQIKNVNELKKIAAGSKGVYLATDPDREGEAIAWHLSEIMGVPPSRFWRVSFDEITAPAVKEAFSRPRKISTSLVNAQQTRRFLDRIMGYKLSPLLWDKITRGLSAGRVQSVALRLVVEREKEIRSFKPHEHWKISADLSAGEKSTFLALLNKLNDANVGSPLDGSANLWIGSEAQSGKLVDYLKKSDFRVLGITEKESNQHPAPPFITSTLQQTASIKLNFSPRKTMLIAQQLYEGVDLPEGPTGLITYMRTDSVRMSELAISGCRKFISRRYGEGLLHSEPRRYRPSKQSQQAHEAIRPTYPDKTPESIAQYLSKDQYKLYTLIWKRFVATQMKPATWKSKSVEIESRSSQPLEPEGTASCELEIFSNDKRRRHIAEKILTIIGENQNGAILEKIITILGRNREDDDAARKILESLGKNPAAFSGEPRSDMTSEREDKTLTARIIDILNETIDQTLIREQIKVERCLWSANERRLVSKGFLTLYNPEEQLLPALNEGVKLDVAQINSSQSFTEPPPRYTEASLVKVLEKYGIGRPSTYAPIISTIQDRGYALKRSRQLEPTELGILVNDKLVPFFDDIINTQFTARIEEELDLIEEDRKEWVSTLKEFYEPFARDLEKAQAEMTSEKGKQNGGNCPKCGKPMVERWSRFGKFLACSSFPECRYTVSLKPKQEPEKTDEVCEKCGKPMVVRYNRRRSKFIACSGYPDCKNAKPIKKAADEKPAPTTAEETTDNGAPLC